MKPVTLFVCGDMMTGRGIDQVLPHPSDPVIHEPYMDSALGYVALAEQANGPIPRAVTPEYIWGDALAEFDRIKPQACIVNLETAITTSQDWQPKGINYRMHPGNIGCLTAAGIDCCVLANNHVLDWGAAGLIETLDTLHAAGIGTAGAGRNRHEAETPAIVQLDNGYRVLVFSFGMESSGVPLHWAAMEDRPGVDFLADLSDRAVDAIAARMHAIRRKGDVVVASVHWGGNWGYRIAPEERRFAHRLIERAGVDLFHGHSSHHPKGIEVHREKLILYGCGDLINDYEGISGHEAFRADLGLMYFPVLDTPSGRLLELQMVPVQMKRLRLNPPCAADTRWLCTMLDREGRHFGTSTQLRAEARVALQWEGSPGPRTASG
ncbi:MAG: CapA family protein [Burkholderiales bacterium]